MRRRSDQHDRGGKRKRNGRKPKERLCRRVAAKLVVRNAHERTDSVLLESGC